MGGQGGAMAPPNNIWDRRLCSYWRRFWGARGAFAPPIIFWIAVYGPMVRYVPMEGNLILIMCIRDYATQTTDWSM